MSLFKKQILFLDCQTTGTQPPRAQMVEIGWSCASAEDFSIKKVHSHVLALPEGHGLPSIVAEITGLTKNDIVAGSPAETVAAMLKKDISKLGDSPLFAAHYCQFERPFIEQWGREFMGLDPLPSRWLCLYKLSKALFPDLPSRNIKALAGFFGPSLQGANRAGPHVEATLRIWHGLVTELEKRGIIDEEGLFQLMATPTKKTKAATPKKPAPLLYRMDRLKRLQIVEQPGIYKMLSQDGQILYVGKAKSLKSRVNSYFRGVKGRDKRKLELMAQVWDIETVPCESPLEAAILESDEIKRINPPYNIALKEGWRPITYFSRDLSSCSKQKDETHRLGPFRASPRLEQVIHLAEYFQTERMDNVFFEPVAPEIFKGGWELFLAENELIAPAELSVRKLLTIGARLLREEKKSKKNQMSEPEEDASLAAEENAPEMELTAKDVAGKFARLLRGAAASRERARKISRLFNARISFDPFKNGALRYLHFVNGDLVDESEWLLGHQKKSQMTVTATVYDRLSIVLSEIESLTKDMLY